MRPIEVGGGHPFLVCSLKHEVGEHFPLPLVRQVEVPTAPGGLEFAEERGRGERLRAVLLLPISRAVPTRTYEEEWLALRARSRTFDTCRKNVVRRRIARMRNTVG